ncbi:restriction endonuclease subunit S [Ruminococcus sp. AF13-28]|nr:restriction endonuclease subunit S [Ruminococcus sp. AF13-37]RGW23618.1 restriction endonuclease subunit S [Ruminococcus sp. AF13-28]
MSKLEQLINELCPEGVEYKALGELGEFYSGLTGKSKDDFSKGNAKFITYMNVFSNLSLKIDVDDKVRIGENENQNTIQYGDVLFTGSSETPKECGMSSVLTSITNEKLYLNSFCFGFRFYDKKLMLPEFSKYVFRSSEIRKQIKRTASGVTRFNVSKKKMEKVTIPLPPIPVQEEIVRILDKFTELTEKLTKELTARKQQYEYYRDSLYLVDDADIEWTTLDKISENCDRQRKPVKKGNRVAGKYPYYGASGIVDYVVDYIFDGDFLLVSEDGANLFARSTPIAFSISGKNWVNNHAHILKFDTYELRRYIEIYLNSINLNKYISGGAQPKLNQESLNKIPIPVPSLERVKYVVSIFDRFDKLCIDISEGLPAEIEARQKRYEYYRDKLFAFKKKEAAENE